MLYWGLSLDSLSTIQIWAHLALTSYMKADWVDNSQVDLTTLILSAHTWPWWLCKDTPTENLKLV